MCLKQIKRVIDLLHENNVKTEKGMNENEINIAQDFYGIVFPPDLKEMLMTFTPIWKSFYNWNDYSPENVKKINDMLIWPIKGCLFDVEHNDFWLKTWGKKPDDLNIKLKIAEEHMEKVPKLIPICSHRYISSIPNEASNPVYSVHQMDIIFYGRDIWDYFEVEYRKKKHQEIEFDKIKPIPFWHDIIINVENLVDSYSGMLLPNN